MKLCSKIGISDWEKELFFLCGFVLYFLVIISSSVFFAFKNFILLDFGEVK